MVKKRGVSPIIATVLLVAMVIAIALIVFIWMRAFTKEAITKFDGENIELSCEKISFRAFLSGGNITITNNGNVPIFDFRVKKISASGSYTEESMRENALTRGWRQTGLNEGESVSVTGYSNIPQINIIPVLLGKTDKNENKMFVCEKYEVKL